MTEGEAGQGHVRGAKIDWLTPLKEPLDLVYIVLLDALALFSIALIANALEIGLNKLTQDTISWKFADKTLSLPEFVHYGDLFIFVVFLGVSLWHVLRWATKR
jgi:hypothetical protein